MKRPCLLALVLLMFALPLTAQETLTATAFGPSPTVVTFTLQGELLSADDGAAGIPLALLERLAEEATLAKLETGNPRFYEMKFAFNSVESFNAWYVSESTRALLAAVQDVSASAVRTSLALIRPAAMSRAGI